MLASDEIRGLCARWASGEFAVSWNEHDQRLLADLRTALAVLEEQVRAEPEAWWEALCDLIADARYLETIENLANPLQALLKLDSAWLARTLEMARKDVRWRYALFCAWPEIDPAPLLTLLGREILISDYVKRDEKWAEWASQFVLDLEIADEWEEVWQIILDVLAGTENEDAICALGAGHLETLIKERGADFIDRIEREAASNTKLRVALACAWVWELEPNLFRRVERAAGDSLTRPKEGVTVPEWTFMPPPAPGDSVRSATELIQKLKGIGVEIRGAKPDAEDRFHSDVEESIECSAPDEPAIGIRRFSDVSARNRFLEFIGRNTIQLRDIIVGDNWLVMTEREETAILITSRLKAVRWRAY